MGYRSDVVLALATGKEWADMFWSAYIIDPRVQEHDLTQFWKRSSDDRTVIFYMKAEGWKWYDNYEDVRGLMHMLGLADTLAEDSTGEVYAATCFMRIGEEEDDNEIEFGSHGKRDDADDCLNLLYDNFGLRRELIVNLEEDATDGDE